MDWVYGLSITHLALIRFLKIMELTPQAAVKFRIWCLVCLDLALDSLKTGVTGLGFRVQGSVGCREV